MTARPRIVLATATERPGLRAPWLLALILAFGAVGAAIGWFGRGLEPREVGELRNEAQLLAGQQAVLEQDLATARRGEQVTREAYEGLRQEIIVLEAELREARSDVAFYQRLLGAGGTRRGLAVHALRVRDTASPLHYRFRLTLSQNLEKAAVVDGRVTVAAEGISGDRMVELDADDLDLRIGDGTSAFEFKYFQEFDGSLRFPDGFVPERIIVELDVEGRRDPVARSFDWSELRLDAPTDAATE
ncbi:MAG: DUF6776 family protein [Pseudomonadota bacterium]